MTKMFLNRSIKTKLKEVKRRIRSYEEVIKSGISKRKLLLAAMMVSMCTTTLVAQADPSSIYEAVKGCDQVSNCGEIAIIRTMTSI